MNHLPHDLVTEAIENLAQIDTELVLLEHMPDTTDLFSHASAEDNPLAALLRHMRQLASELQGGAAKTLGDR